MQEPKSQRVDRLLVVLRLRPRQHQHLCPRGHAILVILVLQAKLAHQCVLELVYQRRAITLEEHTAGGQQLVNLELLALREFAEQAAQREQQEAFA